MTKLWKLKKSAKTRAEQLRKRLAKGGKLSSTHRPAWRLLHGAQKKARDSSEMGEKIWPIRRDRLAIYLGERCQGLRRNGVSRSSILHGDCDAQLLSLVPRKAKPGWNHMVLHVGNGMDAGQCVWMCAVCVPDWSECRSGASGLVTAE